MHWILYGGHRSFLNNVSEGRRRPRTEEDRELTTSMTQKKRRDAHRTETL